MELWEAMENRFSYRGKYTSAPVPHADLEQLLHAGLIAPSGCNRQTPQFLAIDDPVLLKKIATFFNMPNTDTATAGICVLSRPRAAIDGKSYAIQDYSGAIENILLAVTCLGYASCWLEGQTHAPGIAQQI
ncbi:MAG: nitroreductase family protein, partial [Oscillospiraceae bacterium]